MNRIYTFLFIAVTILLFQGVGNTAAAQSFSEQKFELSNGQKKMTVYPLPAAYTVNVYLSPSLKEEADRLEILDITGRKVQEVKLNKQSADVNFNNLSNLANGVYMIAAKDSNGKLLQSAKMIISR